MSKKFTLLLLLIFIIVISIIFIFSFFMTSIQQPKYTIGISQWNTNSDYVQEVKGFKASLAAEGFIENNNVKFFIENPQADISEQANIIQFFVQKKVNLIFTLTTSGTLIAKGITNTIPIVFGLVTYPVDAWVIKSLAASDNNLVGIRNYIPPALQYYYFERLYSSTKNLAFVHQKGEPNSTIQYQEYKKLLSTRGIKMMEIAAIDLDDLRKQLTEQQRHFNALYAACDTLVQDGGEEMIIAFSKKNHIPSFTCNKNGVLKGALIGSFADPYLMGWKAGKKAALILKGNEPRWLHTETPQDTHLAINLVTAKLLGITIPADILEKSDTIVR